MKHIKSLYLSGPAIGGAFNICDSDNRLIVQAVGNLETRSFDIAADVVEAVKYYDPMLAVCKELVKTRPDDMDWFVIQRAMSMARKLLDKMEAE